MKSVITGASGEIGGAIARAFAKRGDNLALLYNANEEAVRALAEEIAAGGVMVVLKKADFSDAAATEAALAELTKEFGAPDVLVTPRASAWSPPCLTPPRRIGTRCLPSTRVRYSLPPSGRRVI